MKNIIVSDKVHKTLKQIKNKQGLERVSQAVEWLLNDKILNPISTTSKSEQPSTQQKTEKPQSDDIWDLDKYDGSNIIDIEKLEKEREKERNEALSEELSKESAEYYNLIHCFGCRELIVGEPIKIEGEKYCKKCAKNLRRSN